MNKYFEFFAETHKRKCRPKDKAEAAESRCLAVAQNLKSRLI